MNLERIPVSLKGMPKWAGFKVADGKKVPVSILDMKGVGANDIARLVPFQKAKEALEHNLVDAIGVSLYDEGITCIDIDCHSDEKQEEFEKLNTEVLSQFNTYAETSISGKGTHLFIKGKKPQGYKHCDRHGIIEVYDCARFIITTGDVVDGHDTYIAICQKELNELCEKHLMKQATVDGGPVGKNVYTKTDGDVLDRLKKFKKGQLFWAGKWQEIEKLDTQTGTYIKAYPSQSEADFAFLSSILYLNGNNVLQAKRIFMQSGMWNEARQRKKSSGYVDYTVNEASLKCTKVYDWDRKSYTETEQTVDIEEILQGTLSNQLLVQAQNNTLTLTTNKELNTFLCKYLLNYDGAKKIFTGTTKWDYDGAANGARFWLINQDDLVYLPEGDEWLKWNDVYWERCYDKNLLVYAEKVFVQLKHEAYNLFIQSTSKSNADLKEDMEKQALELFKYASTRKNLRTCLDMIEFSKSYFVKAQNEGKVLEKVSANINVINLQNGVFDLDAMQYYPHDKKYYQTKVAGVSYDKDAVCPLWKELLDTVLPSADVRHFFQKAVGYIISSEYMEKCMLLMHGASGNNGKTTITRTLYKLMGDYAVIAEKQTIMDSKGHNAGAARPDLIRLRDRRAAFISESEATDRIAEGMLKNMSGGGMVICRTLHHEPIEFPAMFKIVLETNHKPQFSGTDKPLVNRIKLIEFNVEIPPEKIDIHFGDKLEQELSGILNWAIDGYRIYREEGLRMPEEMQKAVQDYAEELSPIDQWITECIEYIPTGAVVCYTSKMLYQSYLKWCKFNNEFAISQRKFTQEINQKEWFKAIKKVKGYTQYLNVALNDVGYLFTEDTSNEGEFRNKYNMVVQNRIALGGIAEKSIKNEIVFGGLATLPLEE